MYCWNNSTYTEPRAIGQDALYLHIYAVVLAVDAVAAHADDLGGAAIQDATIDLRHSAYLPIVHSAQRKHAAAFGSIQVWGQ